MAIDARALIGTHDVLLVTLDSLRYDVARQASERGLTPGLTRLLAGGAWDERHSPGSFTYAAHWAFFAGFLPTPARGGPHPRLFAARFPGSETTAATTCVFDAPDIISGLAGRGYRTVCIGGVGFFNKQSPLGSVLPGLFEESHWSESFGVTDPRSTENQVERALRIVEDLPAERRLFLFVNVSATHQPSCIFIEGSSRDGLETQTSALVHVDGHLPRLVAAMCRRAPVLCVICSDHGTAFGDDGFHGHRISHDVVWTVPYTEFVLEQEEQER